MQKAHRYFSALLASCMGLSMILFMGVGIASAHAAVIDSTPKANSTIAAVPATIQVTTAENMTTNPKDTNLFVYSPKGELISQGNATVDINNPIHMSVKIKTDAGNGIYIVHWITKSALDGDTDDGAFAFTVNPSTTVAPTPTAVTQTTTPSNATSNNNSSPVLPAAIVGVIALLVGLGAGFGFGRTRSVTAPAISNGAKEAESEKTTTTPGT